ncbi:MAG: DedA family protein [Terriglobales bacterium]
MSAVAVHLRISVHWFYHTIREVLTSWGYWAVLLGLLGESAGFPLPGETVLMFASFLAHKHTNLEIQWVIVVGISAAVLGDNAGYFLGRHFGKTFIQWAKKLFHLDDIDIQAARDLIKRHGGRTIFFSRFIFGLRTIAGPLAGSLDMEWKRFFKFNVLGAATWVCAMAWAGYGFAKEFETLLGYIEKASWAMAAGLFFIGYWIWHRQKHHYRERQNKPA